MIYVIYVYSCLPRCWAPGSLLRVGAVGLPEGVWCGVGGVGWGGWVNDGGLLCVGGVGWGVLLYVVFCCPRCGVDMAVELGRSLAFGILCVALLESLVVATRPRCVEIAPAKCRASLACGDASRRLELVLEQGGKGSELRSGKGCIAFMALLTYLASGAWAYPHPQHLQRHPYAQQSQHHRPQEHRNL